MLLSWKEVKIKQNILSILLNLSMSRESAYDILTYARPIIEEIMTLLRKPEGSKHDINDKLQAVNLIPFFTQTVQTMKLFKSNQVETYLLDILYNQKSKAPIKTSAVRALLVLYSATNLLANEQERVCTLLNEKEGCK